MKRIRISILLALVFVLFSLGADRLVFAGDSGDLEPEPFVRLKFVQSKVDPAITTPDCSLEIQSTKLSQGLRTELLTLLRTAGFSFAHTRIRTFQGLKEAAHPQGIVFKQYKRDLPPSACIYSIDVEVNNFRVLQTAKFDDGCRNPKILKLLQFLLQQCSEHKSKGNQSTTNILDH